MPHERPYTDDEILGYLVGEPPKPYEIKVVIADYDPRWPEWFAEEAESIRMAMGSGALGVEHIGSTSVPGLPAKPIIDIDLVVADSSNEDTYLPALVAAGFAPRVREPEWHEHRCFYKRTDNGANRDVNLHVYTEGCAEYQRVRTFRDWLRTHPEDLALYRDTKLELATKDWKYVQNYADAKTPVVQAVLDHAGWTEIPCVKY